MGKARQIVERLKPTLLALNEHHCTHMIVTAAHEDGFLGVGGNVHADVWPGTCSKLDQICSVARPAHRC